MNKMGKNIIASLTAIAMALALVTSVFPTTVAHAEEIDKVGTKVDKIAGIYNTGSVLDGPMFRTNNHDGKTFYYSLLKRVPDQDEIDRFVYATNEDTWTYDASAFPLTMQADTTYYVMVKCVADEGNNFESDIQPIIVGTDEYGNYGLYSVNTPNDTIYYWFAYKTNPSEPIAPSDEPTADTSQDTKATADSTTQTSTQTAKAKAPKTGDEFPYALLIMIAAGASAIGVVTIRKRNK